MIKEQIDYEILCERYSYNRSQLDELLALIEEIMANKSDTIVICGSNYPVKMVQERFRKLDSMHIEYVLGCLQENTSKISKEYSYSLFTRNQRFCGISRYVEIRYGGLQLDTRKLFTPERINKILKEEEKTDFPTELLPLHVVLPCLG